MTSPENERLLAELRLIGLDTSDDEHLRPAIEDEGPLRKRIAELEAVDKVQTRKLKKARRVLRYLDKRVCNLVSELSAITRHNSEYRQRIAELETRCESQRKQLHGLNVATRKAYGDYEARIAELEAKVVERAYEACAVSRPAASSKAYPKRYGSFVDRRGNAAPGATLSEIVARHWPRDTELVYDLATHLHSVLAGVERVAMDLEALERDDHGADAAYFAAELREVVRG